MQEQTPYNMTPEQGWSQMKPILDREMPVGKRSRRFVPIWWSMAGITLLALAGLLLFNTDSTTLKSNDPIPSLDPASNPSGPKQENSTEESKQTPVNTEFADNTSSINPSKNLVEAEQLRPAPRKRNILKSEVQTSPEQEVHLSGISVAPAMEESQTSYSMPAEEPITNTSATIAEEFSVAQHEVITPLHTDAFSGSTKSDAITDPIATLDMDYFSIPVEELGEIYADHAVQPLKNKLALRPSLEINSLSGLHGGAGVYGGAGLDVRLSSRFNLTMGLGYRSFNPTATVFSGGQKDLTADVNNNGLINTDSMFDEYPIYVASELLSSASYEDLDPVVESLHQWQSQLGLSYDLSRRFLVEGGMGLSFHTRAYSEYPIVEASYLSSPDKSRVSSSLNEYNVIRTSMTSLYAGIGYHIGRHLVVKLQWLHTSQPYLSTNKYSGAYVVIKQRDDFIRGLTLGMKYSFM